MTPNDHYSGRTAPLTSKVCILYIYSTNICTEYFKHCIYSSFFSLQNAICFIILTYLVPVFSNFIYRCAKIKKKIRHQNNKWLLCVIHTVEHNYIYVLIHKKITTTCFGPTCGPSTGWVLTYRISHTNVWGIWAVRGWGGGGKRDLVISTVGIMATSC